MSQDNPNPFRQLIHTLKTGELSEKLGQLSKAELQARANDANKAIGNDIKILFGTGSLGILLVGLGGSTDNLAMAIAGGISLGGAAITLGLTLIEQRMRDIFNNHAKSKK